MQNIHWEMMTQFVFPENVGTVEEVISVNIKPRWQQIDTEDSIRLLGIYHITATARFNPKEFPEYSEGTLIEHLDFNGNDGYFEYALPLEVDLPKEKVGYNQSPQISVDDVSFFVYDGSSCTFKWEAKCTFPQKSEDVQFAHELISDDQESLEDIIEKAPYEAFESSSSSSSENVSYDFELNIGEIENEQEEIENDSVVQIKTFNQFSPLDQDDFYSELEESYTLVKLSNKINI